MSMLLDDEGRAVGWEDVRLTEEEMDQMCDALELGDEETATAVVDRAYARLYARLGAGILESEEF
jgi:hypothetical protein